MCWVRYVPRHTAGITGTRHFGKFATASIPVPEISVSSVRWQKYTTGTGMDDYTGAGTKNYLRRVLFLKNLKVCGNASGTTLKYRVCSVRISRVPVLVYDINTGTWHFGKFSTSIPVPKTSVTLVQHPYRYQTLRQVRYDKDTGTGHFGKLGTTSTLVPGVPRYRTEHTLENV